MARFPVDEWERQGAPYMTETEWVKMCMVIALHGTEDLGSVMNARHKLREYMANSDKKKHAQATREKPLREPPNDKQP